MKRWPPWTGGFSQTTWTVSSSVQFLFFLLALFMVFVNETFGVLLWSVSEKVEVNLNLIIFSGFIACANGVLFIFAYLRAMHRSQKFKHLQSRRRFRVLFAGLCAFPFLFTWPNGSYFASGEFWLILPNWRSGATYMFAFISIYFAIVVHRCFWSSSAPQVIRPN